MGQHLDAEFLSAPLTECAEAALSVAEAMGAGFAEIRVMTTTSSAVTVRDRSLENSINDLVTGVGVRVLGEPKRQQPAVIGIGCNEGIVSLVGEHKRNRCKVVIHGAWGSKSDLNYNTITLVMLH